MVVYLIPGLMDKWHGDRYGRIRDGAYAGDVGTAVRRELAGEDGGGGRGWRSGSCSSSKYPDFLLPYMMSRAGQILIQRTILKQEADRLHLQVSDDDLMTYLQTGPFARVPVSQWEVHWDGRVYQLHPDGDWTGTRRVASFEEQVKEDMELQRLQALITGGVTVSDAAVREAYLVQGTKVKFDYAVVSLEDIKKSINPSDADLQAYFKQNAAKVCERDSGDAED